MGPLEISPTTGKNSEPSGRNTEQDLDVEKQVGVAAHGSTLRCPHRCSVQRKMDSAGAVTRGESIFN